MLCMAVRPGVYCTTSRKAAGLLVVLRIDKPDEPGAAREDPSKLLCRARAVQG